MGLSLSELSKMKAAAAPSESPAPKAAAPLNLFAGATANRVAAETPATKPPASKDSAATDFSLDDVDLSDIAAERDPESDTSEYTDHFDLSVPIRANVGDLTEQQKAFVSLLDSVYELHHDPDTVKSAITRIMIDMKETPYLADLVVDTDVTAIIRVMRNILGFRKTVEKKAKAKRAGGSRNKKAVDEMAALLGDFDLGGI